ncbi:MAG: hypothetical protein H6835_14345 [Planctomycetes bacterium]|nr:hypothetical protein [Planctomycetota bacterium]
MNRTSPAFAAFCFALLAGAAPAQDDAPTRLAALNEQAAKLLNGFAKKCESYKSPARARRVYALVLERYDADSVLAHRGLGHKKKGDQWIDGGGSGDGDTSNGKQQEQIDKAWQDTSTQLAKLHREHALALQQEGDESGAKQQFEFAVDFDPRDAVSHKALGHEQVDGYFGPPEQIAFLRRMHEIFAKAKELREKEYDTELLSADKMPAELKATGLPMCGAKSRHFTHWVIDSSDEAVMTLQWAERSYELMEFLLGSQSRRLKPTEIRWLALLRSDEQRDLLFAKSPSTTGNYSADQARLFGGTTFKTAGGRASVWWYPDKGSDADRAVAHVSRRCFGDWYNPALAEGLMHCCQWLLCDSILTYYADLPKTVAAGSWTLPRLPEEWFKFLQEEIEQHQDWPLVQVPRERMDNFRDRVRVKTWSFMLYLVAREPLNWWRVMAELSDEDLMPEEIGKTIGEVLDRPVEQIEEEYREWARRGSRLGRASGWQ